MVNYTNFAFKNDFYLFVILVEVFNSIYTKNNPKSSIYCNDEPVDKNIVLYMYNVRCDELCPYLLYSADITSNTLKHLKSKFIIFAEIIHPFDENIPLPRENIILSNNNIVYLYVAISITDNDNDKLNNLQYYTNFSEFPIQYNQYLVNIVTFANVFEPYIITKYLKHISICYGNPYDHIYGRLEDINYPYNENVRYMTNSGVSFMVHIIDE